ncbi:MAG: hypothetical protein KF716_03950 [Anaerolineae bacterium]|nr:hypothetical protein [Anaerolineae bacterium]
MDDNVVQPHKPRLTRILITCFYLAVVAIIVLIFLALIGPQIGNVFSSNLNLL